MANNASSTMIDDSSITVHQCNQNVLTVELGGFMSFFQIIRLIIFFAIMGNGINKMESIFTPLSFCRYDHQFLSHLYTVLEKLTADT